MAGDDDARASARESSAAPGPSSASVQREQSAAAAPSPALSSTSSQTRYQPQFSASTQMILQKIRGETSNYNKAISSASASGAFQQAAYEDTKRRLAQSMNMTASLTMPLPSTIASASGSSTAPARFVGGKPHAKLPGTLEPPKTAPLRSTAKAAAKRGGRAAKGTKRRKTSDGDAASAGGSDPSDEEGEGEGEGAYQEVVHTMTKSGRQVSKPTQFNPAAVSGAAKRKHYGKRTPEQALCKACTRGLSPPNNQIVFCDGCNLCWHQLCHDPFIDDEFVSDETRSWFCRACTAKREKHLAKKKSISDFKGASWANKTVEQRRAYLASQSQGNLVNLVMYSLELHPDLPLFPVPESAAAAKRAAQNAGAGSSARGGSQRADPSAAGPINYTAPPTVTNPSKANAKTPQNQDEREGSSDSVPPAWPKPGQGVLAKLVLNEDDFQDNNDFEAFSVATYDAKGKKVVENGMAVST